MKYALPLLTALLLAPLALHATDAPKPNILIILADDVGYGDLGCYGQKTLRTPNLDRLAAEGMEFTRHYAGSTVCARSRCLLMTGLHTGHCRVRQNGPGLIPGTENKPGTGVATPDGRKQWAPQLLAEDVQRFLDERAKDKSRPFFLYYALNLPHANNEAGAYRLLDLWSGATVRLDARGVKLSMHPHTIRQIEFRK